MKRVLLTTLFAFFAIMGFSQTAFNTPTNTADRWEWVLRLGLNALDQSANSSDLVSSKSALGFQAGADVIWNPGWKIKGGIQYQYHEIFEINEKTNIITARETSDRNFQRLKLTAGTLYDLIDIDYLTIGLGADGAYNFDLSNHSVIRTDFNNAFDLEYFSGLVHVYVNIKRLQIDFGIEGNLFGLSTTDLKPLQSKTYTLTLGYFF